MQPPRKNDTAPVFAADAVPFTSDLPLFGIITTYQYYDRK